MGCGGPGARLRAAALHSEQRLRTRDAPGDARELARVAEGLEVEQDELRLVVLLPVLEQVVRGDVGLVPDRDEGREAERPRAGGLEQREAESAALGREPDRPLGERARSERRVETRPADGDPEAVGPYQARAVGTDESEQLLLPSRARLPHLGESRRDHADGTRPVP